MKTFIKALIIGYVTIWGYEWVQKFFQNERINNMDDLIRVLRTRL
jgi:hypothetical protein